MLLEYKTGMEIIRAAQKEKSEELLFNRWAVAYQRVMSFDEFKRQLGVGQRVEKTEMVQKPEEILSEVRRILNGDF